MLTDTLQDIDEVVVRIDIVQAASHEQALHDADLSGAKLGQHANGKASRAEFESSKQHGWVYEVEVVSGAKVLDVKVDADKGTILSSNEDKSDRDDEHDEKD